MPRGAEAVSPAVGPGPGRQRAAWQRSCAGRAVGPEQQARVLGRSCLCLLLPTRTAAPRRRGHSRHSRQPRCCPSTWSPCPCRVAGHFCRSSRPRSAVSMRRFTPLSVFSDLSATSTGERLSSPRGADCCVWPVTSIPSVLCGNRLRPCPGWCPLRRLRGRRSAASLPGAHRSVCRPRGHVCPGAFPQRDREVPCQPSVGQAPTHLVLRPLGPSSRWGLCPALPPNQPSGAACPPPRGLLLHAWQVSVHAAPQQSSPPPHVSPSQNHPEATCVPALSGTRATAVAHVPPCCLPLGTVSVTRVRGPSKPSVTLRWARRPQL